MTNTPTIIPAAAGWFVAVYDEGPHYFEKHDVIGWEITGDKAHPILPVTLNWGASDYSPNAWLVNPRGKYSNPSVTWKTLPEEMALELARDRYLADERRNNQEVYQEEPA